jgi:protein-L-isoaspartate(D-aspartate) O-methyltransferase
MAEADARDRMVARQIRGRGVTDERVLAAMSRVPRDRFVPGDRRAQAYHDTPLPIGHGQTISQPYIVGFMSAALDLHPQHRVLEIGAGSGYQTAILAELAADVFAIERIDALTARARLTLEALGYRNVHLETRDGALGWPQAAPFDRILVAAAASAIPPALVDQLADGGRLAIPVGDWNQELQILCKEGTGMRVLERMAVRFVPLVH